MSRAGGGTDQGGSSHASQARRTKLDWLSTPASGEILVHENTQTQCLFIGGDSTTFSTLSLSQGGKTQKKSFVGLCLNVNRIMRYLCPPFPAGLRTQTCTSPLALSLAAQGKTESRSSAVGGWSSSINQCLQIKFIVLYKCFLARVGVFNICQSTRRVSRRKNQY